MSRLVRRQELPSAQVFIQMPYMLGNEVYALGNEYYMKKRNLHRYNVSTDKWSTIF